MDNWKIFIDFLINFSSQLFHVLFSNWITSSILGFVIIAVAVEIVTSSLHIQGFKYFLKPIVSSFISIPFLNHISVRRSENIVPVSVSDLSIAQANFLYSSEPSGIYSPVPQSIYAENNFPLNPASSRDMNGLDSRDMNAVSSRDINGLSNSNLSASNAGNMSALGGDYIKAIDPHLVKRADFVNSDFVKAFGKPLGILGLSMKEHFEKSGIQVVNESGPNRSNTEFSTFGNTNSNENDFDVLKKTLPLDKSEIPKRSNTNFSTTSKYKSNIDVSVDK